jgi:hypothetical protein
MLASRCKEQIQANLGTADQKDVGANSQGSSLSPLDAP